MKKENILLIRKNTLLNTLIMIMIEDHHVTFYFHSISRFFTKTKYFLLIISLISPLI